MTDTERQQRYLQSRRAKAKEHLGGKCVKCGTPEDLQFDHIDPATKEIEISNAIAKHWAWVKLLTELDKCQLLCVECHKEKSRLESLETITHGKEWAAIKKNCLCDACINSLPLLKEKRNADRRLKREPRPKFPPRTHGTRAMYLFERRQGLDTCAKCRRANTQYTISLKRARVAK